MHLRFINWLIQPDFISQTPLFGKVSHFADGMAARSIGLNKSIRNLKRYAEVSAHERAEFEKTASSFDDEQVRTFACMLLHTGCRISEALSLTYEAIDFEVGTITIQTLKRRKVHFRLVPLPPAFLDILKIVHRPSRKNGKKPSDRLWTFSRSTAWRYIKQLMNIASIKGHQTSPKGLRHGFGVACIERNIPIHIVQKWMGHASPNTTTIYLQVTGQEERGFAERLWG